MSKKKDKARDKAAARSGKGTGNAKPRALYEAADPRVVPSHKSWRDNRDGDATVAAAGSRLRNFARHLDQNHDISRGAIDRLIQFVIGPNGIAIEPLPRRKDGSLHREFADQLLELWDEWIQWPDVTWEHDWIAIQHLLGRSLFRDGEVLVQIVTGDIASLDHGTRVPMSLELLEADHLPFDLNDPARGITQGIERNAWGRPRAYHLYLQHPGSFQSPYALSLYGINGLVKRVSTDNILHLKLVDRIKQARGASKFASVIRRLSDIKDYEDSERIAAKFAANLTAYIKKTIPDLMPDGYEYGVSEINAPRSFPTQPGMVFDDLRPGEEVDVIDSKRPNPNLDAFRSSQLRAASAGLGVGYSSFSRDYDGSYSSQRQELVEQQGYYEMLTMLFIGQGPRPVWQRFVSESILSRQAVIPSDLDVSTVAKALYRGPSMIWIDPLKEINALIEAMKYYLTSPQKIIRQRGDNFVDILKQFAEWNSQLDTLNLPHPDLGSRPNTQDPANADEVVPSSRRRR